MSIRNPWLIEERDYSTAKDLRSKINFWLRYAVLAASAHNTQPWRCIFEDNTLFVYRDEDQTLGSDQTTRLAHIGIGAFIENLSIASKNWGYKPKVHITVFSPNELEIAQISFDKMEEAARRGGSELFKAITTRHTNRGLYVPGVPDKILLNKTADDKEGSAKPFIVTDVSGKKRIGELVAKGTDIALSLPFMKRELASFIYSSRKPKEIGMPIESMIPGHLKKLVRPETAIKFINPKSLARENMKKYSQAPALVLIGTYEDGPTAWIDAGRLMQRALLRAASMGYSHDIAAGPIEIPTLLPSLRNEIPPDMRPQLLFRIGRAVSPSLSVSSGRKAVEV